jgi:SAM-dependent methyltransferase
VSYAIYLWDNLSPIEWSQAAWRVEGTTVSAEACDGELIHEVMFEHLPKDGLIVDAGCGTAKWPIYLRQAGYRCAGIEISSDGLAMARQLDGALPLVRADARQAPIRAGSVAAVLSLGVVEHDPAGPLASLREIRRMLRPGGVLVLAVPFNNMFRRLLVNHLQSWVTWRRRRAGITLGFAEYRFSRREIESFLGEADFEIVATYPNDLRPPKIMGLWVDHSNLVFDPIANPPGELFVLHGLRGRLGAAALRWFPWFVCGEATYVARAR